MLTHKGTQTITTKRLILRRFSNNDYKDFFEWTGCPETSRFNMKEPYKSIDEAINELSEIVDSYKNSDYYMWGIIYDNELIGFCCGNEINEEIVSICLGYGIKKAYWNKGITTEAAKAMIDYFFDIGFNRVFSYHNPLNLASGKVMLKSGMTFEGLIRGGSMLAGEICDCLQYSILGDEWEAQKEIEYYKSLPCIFDNFIDIPELNDGTIHLVCVAKRPAIPEKKYCPAYDFAICKGSEKVGEINLRIGYGGFGPNESSLYYGGQIGYGIDEKHRGNGYAVSACKLVVPVAKAHGMTKLLITNNVTNIASRRVCEKLGLQHIRIVRLPEWTDLYKDGQRYSNIYEWSVE